MPGRPGQRLTPKETEEIELYNTEGLRRPSKYDDAVYDSSLSGGAGYRWATQEEKRRGDEEARQTMKVSAAREQARERIRDVAAGRAASGEPGQDEGSPFVMSETAGVGSVEGEAGVVYPGESAPVMDAAASNPSAPQPMPASLANAMRVTGARPVSRGTKTTVTSEGTPPAARPMVEGQG